MKKNIFITFILIVSMIVFMGMLNKVNAADVEITFKDNVLYDKVTTYYNASIISKDAENLKIVMTDEVIAKITDLNLNGNPATVTVPVDRRIKDLSGIEKFTALKTLRLDQNSITDLSPIADLENLIDLDLRANLDLTDISVVQNLPNLTQLMLDNCNISQDDIEIISKCTTLKKLGLPGCSNITDISKLADLTNLQRLWLERTPITSIDALKDLTSLKELNINYIKDIKSLDALKNLTNLEGLYCCGCSITDISPLANLSKLTTLRIENNNISDISVISNLTNLQALNASNNHISDSTPVEGREWKGLDLSNQTISMKAKASSSITLPEIFRATLDSSNVMYISDEMQYLNCKKIDNNKIQLGNNGEFSMVIVGASQDKDATFNWAEEYVSSDLNNKMIKSAQGSRLTITLEEEKEDTETGKKEETGKKDPDEEGKKDPDEEGKKDPDEDDTQAKDDKLPYTGKGITIVMIMLGLAIVATVAYRKVRYLKEI